MFRNLFIILLVFIASYVGAQTAGYVTYKVITNKNENDIQLYEMAFKDDLSHYKFKRMAKANESSSRRIGESNNMVVNLATDSLVLKTNGLLKKHHDGSAYEEVLIRDAEKFENINSFFVYDPNIKMKWNISDEKKRINNMDAYKASTTFRGHSYDAWFTYDLPLPIGPWKFNGLPGLILSVEATDFNYSWEISDIRFADQVEIDSRIFEGKNYIAPKDKFEKEKAYHKAKIADHFNKVMAKLPPSMRPRIKSDDEKANKAELEYKFD